MVFSQSLYGFDCYYIEILVYSLSVHIISLYCAYFYIILQNIDRIYYKNNDRIWKIIEIIENITKQKMYLYNAICKMYLVILISAK